MNTIWLAFLTGLTTGGISCLAVQGGLLASSIAHRRELGLANGEQSGSKWIDVTLFLGAKLVAYTLLGFLLGLVGSSLVLTPKLLGTVQIAAGLFMLATAARIADIHPIFRYFVIAPPKWAYKLLRNTTRGDSFLAPAMLGFFTVLMPCGITQATMAIAVASASPWLGAAIMGAFVLGTSPIFFILGATVSQLLQKKAFSYAAAAVILVFGILSFNGGMALRGSIYTIQNFYKAATTPIDQLTYARGQVAGVSRDGRQDVTINVTSRGYTSSAQSLYAGVPVRLSLVTNNTAGCTRVFTIPDLNISKVLQQTGTEVVEFTPKKAGQLVYACGMGMFNGKFEIIQKS